MTQWSAEAAVHPGSVSSTTTAEKPLRSYLHSVQVLVHQRESTRLSRSMTEVARWFARNSCSSRSSVFRRFLLRFSAVPASCFARVAAGTAGRICARSADISQLRHRERQGHRSSAFSARFSCPISAFRAFGALFSCRSFHLHLRAFSGRLRALSARCTSCPILLFARAFCRLLVQSQYQLVQFLLVQHLSESHFHHFLVRISRMLVKS